MKTQSMHETALVRDVVRRINQLADAAGAHRVVAAKVWLGALSHLSAEHFHDHFAIAAAGTPAAGAALKVETSDDPHDPNAQHARLESIELD
jgi:hydrogenase nickel incorporation protein HypA/HybF